MPGPLGRYLAVKKTRSDLLKVTRHDLQALEGLDELEQLCADDTSQPGGVANTSQKQREGIMEKSFKQSIYKSNF